MAINVWEAKSISKMFDALSIPYARTELTGAPKFDKSFLRTHEHPLVQSIAQAREFNKDSLCHHAADATDIKGHESIKRVYADSGKSPTLNSCSGGNREPKVLCGALRGRSFDKDGNKTNWKDGEHKQTGGK